MVVNPDHPAPRELPVEFVWEVFSRRQQNSDPCPWWGCKSAPSCGEVQKAIREGRFRSKPNDVDQHLGDRNWHIERIAYLVKNWRDDDPIEMKKPITELDVHNGGHRLIAARCLGKTTILGFERA